METRNCQNCKKDFLIDGEDFKFYEKMKVPAPTFCPDCRAQRRFIWRNERALYKRPCDKCKQPFIALYPENSPFTVYCKECWYGDDWNPVSFGMDYDSNKTFFAQFRELQLRVPRLGIWTVQCHNSPYTNLSYSNKNCYLLFGVRDSEDSAYAARDVNIKKCFDVCYTHHSENLYECVNLDKSYNVSYGEESEAVIDSNFVSQSRNIQNSFGAINERGGSNIFFGEKLSKDEYENKIKDIDLGSRSTVEKYKEIFENLKKKAIHKYANLINCHDSTGDHLINGRNCKMVFDGFELENARYSSWVFTSKEISDCWGMGGSEFVYEAVSPEEVSNAKFVHVTDSSHDVEYTDLCKGSSSLFGCVALQKNKYCILNKAYSKEDYEVLKQQIIKDMMENPYIDSKGRVFTYGEFFPYDFSPFAYNETTAQEFYPLSKEEALGLGFKWKDADERNYQITLRAQELSDNIQDVNESILKQVIECPHIGKCMHQCTEAFKITQMEFNFYKSRGIPLPIFCPNCRFYSRLDKRNPMKLYHRSCMCDKQNHFHGKGKCEVEFETTFSPDRTEIIYCEKCYQQEVY